MSKISTIAQMAIDIQNLIEQNIPDAVEWSSVAYGKAELIIRYADELKEKIKELSE